MSAAGQPPREDVISETAARWTVRRDRGLSAAESIEFELWLADDPRHPAAMARAGGTWAQLNFIPDDLARSSLEEGRRSRRWWRVVAVAAPLTAAAAIALAYLSLGDGTLSMAPFPAAGSPVALQAVGPRLVALADGTEVRLNVGSEIVERFSASERGVELTRGEAHFTVTKDPTRPFVVSAGALRVRAIGTAFNVSRGETQTDVLVTEGRVALLTEAGDGSPRRLSGPKLPGQSGNREGGGEPENGNRTAEEAPPMAELGAGERAVVRIAGPSSGEALPEIAIIRVEAGDIRRELAWQENLLRIGGATLGEIAAEIERRTGQRVVLADPALAEVRLGGRFRANDAEGFANLLTAMLDVEAERTAGGAIVLRKKK